MTYKIPPTTKAFLSQLMENKIHKGVGDDFLNFKKSYLLKFDNLQEEDCSKYFASLDSGQPLAMNIPPECLKMYEEKKKKENAKPKNFGVGSSGKDEKKSDENKEEKLGDHLGIFNPMTIKNPADIMLGDTDIGGTLLTPASWLVGGIGEYLMKSKAAPYLAKAVASKIPGGLGGALGSKMGRIVGKAGEAFSDILGSSYVDVNADDIAFQNTRNLIAGAGSPFYKLQVPARQDDRYDWWRKQQLLSSP